MIFILSSFAAIARNFSCGPHALVNSIWFFLTRLFIVFSLLRNRRRGLFMTASSSLHKRKALFFVILFIAFSAFTADILDLREELHLLSCMYSSLDNNVTTGIASCSPLEAEPVILLLTVHQKSSVRISFLHLLPYAFRAPPFWS
jgi:hypothetical protein